MNGKVDFGELKVAPVDMRDLELSIKEKWLDGTPVGGISHYNLLCFIYDTFSKSCDLQIQSIWAVNNRDKVRPGVTQDAALAKELGPDSAQSMIFRRIHALIYLGPTAEVSTALAVSWHQLGFAIGIGPNVRICENGCILKADHIVSSYTLPEKGLKDRKLPLEKIKETLQGWANEYHAIDDEGLGFMTKLGEVELSMQDMMIIFGRLGFDRIQADLGSKVIESAPFAALNQSQLNVAMTRYAEDHFGIGCKEDKTITGWDAMNYLNYPLKPHSCDVPLILPQQYAATKTMLDYVKANK